MFKRILKKIINSFFTKNFSKTLFSLKSFFYSKKKQIIVLITLAVFVVFFDLVSAILVLKIFSISQGNVSEGIIPFLDIANININLSDTKIMISFIILLQILREFFLFLNNYIPGKIMIDIDKEIKFKSLKNLLASRKKDLDEQNKNTLVMKIYSSTSDFSVFVRDFIKFIGNFLIVLSYLFTTFYYQPFPSFVICTLLLLILVLTNRLIIVQQIIGKKLRDAGFNLHNSLIHTFQGILDIFCANKQRVFQQNNENKVSIMIKIQHKFIKLTSLLPSLQRSMAIFFLGLFLIIVEYLKELNFNFIEFSSSLLIIFLLFRIQTPVLEMNILRSSILRRVSHVDVVLDILKNKTSRPLFKKNKKIFTKYYNDIKFKKISFSYDKAETLRDISLHIRKNKTTGIVGPTGSGKSTLVNLLLKFDKPKKGLIEIDNNNLEKLDSYLWRDKISLISQKGHIFNASINDNISMFDPKVDIKDIIKASKIAGLDKLVQSFSKKYKTIIGGEELKLSGGQKQRLFIARAIVKKPSILILDEATSAQDSISENQILKQINKSYKNITIIIIAHRFTALRSCDYIYCLNEGKIIEHGTWGKLSKIKDGEFNRMLQVQKLDDNKN
tara:strand:+ start:523 stop:2361 length:1839 start_codon:yes stop_codon:yes gene_type:complete